MLSNEILLAQSFIDFIMPLNCSLHVHFQNINLTLTYTTTSMIKSTSSSNIVIIIDDAPRLVNRHMLIDMEKSIGKLLPSISDRVRIRYCGDHNSTINRLIIGNRTLYDEQAFYAAVHWLLENQDFRTGCWFIHVRRYFGLHQQYRVSMPWCSAMAQGHDTLFDCCQIVL
jgi:hypothetical protein